MHASTTRLRLPTHGSNTYAVGPLWESDQLHCPRAIESTSAHALSSISLLRAKPSTDYLLLPRLDIAVTVADDDTEMTRYVSSIAGDLSLTFSVEDEFLSTGIIDPQGSIVATTSKQAASGGSGVVWSGLSLFDEYGNPVTAKTTDTGAITYGWSGGKERATDTTGLVLMGVRLYNSVTGHFTSVDPVKGGNTTRYTYPQDPINKYDLDGKKWSGKKTASVLKVVGKVTAVVGLGACVLATAGLCGAATAVGLGISAVTNVARWQAKEISGRRAILNTGVDFAFSRIKAVNNYKKLPFQGRASNSIRSRVSGAVRSQVNTVRYSFQRKTIPSVYGTRFNRSSVRTAGHVYNTWRSFR